MHAVKEFEPVRELAETFVSNVWESLVSHDMTYQYEPEPEEIENDSVPGFIPHTSGGFHAVICQYIGGACNGEPEPIQEIIDANIGDMCAEFARQNEIELPEHLSARDGWKLFNWLEEELDAKETYGSEKLHDFEREWFQDDIYFWKVRAMFHAPDDPNNETGEPEVYFDAYINTDLGYGRDYIGWLSCYGSNPNQTTGDWKKTYTVAHLEKLIKRFGAEKLACALAGSAFASLSTI